MDAAERQARNKALAEALGWHVENTTDFEGDNVWTLYNPQGEAVPAWYNGDYPHTEVYSSPDAAWDLVPDFYSSQDATAATLEPARDYTIEASYDGPPYTAWIEPMTTLEHTYRGIGATRAEALANAVLQWALAQQAAQP